MVKLNSKLKAATLMESIIAMIIIVVSFGIGVLIYANVLDSDNNRQQTQAILLMNEEAIQTKNDKIYLDGEKKIGDWILAKTISRYQQIDNLLELDLYVKDKEGKLIATRNELIIVE